MLKLSASAVIALLSVCAYCWGAMASVESATDEGLILVHDDTPFPVYISSSEHVAPHSTLTQLAAAKVFFDKLFKFDLPFSVLFIENEKWQDHAFFGPPGMPQAGNGKIILSAEKSVIAHLVEKRMTNLSGNSISALVEVYGRPLNLDLFYRDALSVHELAHLYHFRAASKPQRKWLQELFATLSMIAFFENYSDHAFDTMNTYPSFAIHFAEQHAEFKTLTAFEEKYVTGMKPQNYEWYQFKLYHHARSIIDKEGYAVIPKLLTFLIDTDLEKTRHLSDEELVEFLSRDVSNDVASVLTQWPVE